MRLFKCLTNNKITRYFIILKNPFTSKNSIEIKLFHGTTRDRAEAILNFNFNFSESDEDWLGTGVYFFLDGIASGLKSAQEWALNTHKGVTCSVIETTVVTEREQLLDLRVLSDLKLYNKIRDQIIIRDFDKLSRRRDISIKKRRDIRLDDTLITNEVLNILGKKLIIHNVYIKTSQQRELILESSYPNSTVASLKELSLITKIEIKH
jgi:hypothetical protein